MCENFKKICTKAGLALVLIVIFRCVTDGLVLLLAQLLKGADHTVAYFVTSCASLLMLYGGCILATALAFGFKADEIRGMYKKPQRLGKAVSWILPAYGAGQLINFAVLAISFLLLGNGNAVQQTFQPITNGSGPASAAVMIFTVFQLSVFAPLFEEFWFRGIIQSRLIPYGNGFAIMVSALAFGFAHGNLHQFCYTFVIGIVLGYIRYATGGILATTIIHCILNSIAAVILLMVSSEPVTSALYKMQHGTAPSDFENTMITVLGITMLVVLIFMIAGIFAAIGKLKKNRLYRPVDNCPELTKSEKTQGLLKNPVFIAGTLLCTGYIIVQIIIS